MSSSLTIGEQEKAFVQGCQPIFSYALSMVIKATIELGVFDLLAVSGPDAKLTAGEIAAKLLSCNSMKGATMLDLMLRFMASNSILTTSCTADRDGRSVNRYGLAPAGLLMAKSKDQLSLAPFFLINLHKDIVACWTYLWDGIREGITPFERAHGSSMYKHLERNPAMGNLFNEFLENHSKLVTTKLTESYKDGLMQINDLVDVGGGSGVTLSIITSKFPHIRGINFDLPHVISQAPSIPGVEHISGDMFQMIPSGGVILLKWILHNWDDEHCVAILTSCWKVLPPSGKVIIVEYILPQSSETKQVTDEAYALSICMNLLFEGGKERTEHEFRSVAEAAQFSEFRICCEFLNFHVIELVK